jgi:hypothetical protein
MITYLYWFFVIFISAAVAWPVARFLNWRAELALASLLLLVGWGLFYFKYEQFFVKNYGGVMTLTMPQGQVHLSSTWKDDHLWIENYDPKNNTCYFSEYSKGHMLQGQVVIENCNPVLPAQRP